MNEIHVRAFQGETVKGFYLYVHLIALRTIPRSPLISSITQSH